MSINVTINGINKNVISPEAYVDGIWRQVNVVKNNINGIWRESYNRNVYKINLYRYGVLYDTISVVKGSSVTLPSVSTVYDDDIAHYGWTKTAGNTTRDYAATASITPTDNMDLYAVYSYKITEETEMTTTIKSNQSAIHEQTFTFPLACTAQIYGWSGSTQTVMTLQTTGSTIPYISYKGNRLSGTLSSTQYINVSVTADSVMTFGLAAYVTHTGGEAYTLFEIHHLGYKEVTQYRSSYGNYTVSLYNGNTLYTTIDVAQGTTCTLPQCTTAKNNVLLGWSIASDSTTIKYTTDAIVRPTGDLTLYAVYADYSYLDTDGDGYFIFTGGYKITTESYSANGGHQVGTAYGSYNMTITFTDGSTKTITLGNSEGETTVQFDSVVGVINVPVPEGSTEYDNGSDYRTAVSRTYNCVAHRYIY